MPLPQTTSVGKIISFLDKEEPNLPRDQKIAIALSSVKPSKKKK